MPAKEKLWKVYYYAGKSVANGVACAPDTWGYERVQRAVREKPDMAGPILVEPVDSAEVVTFDLMPKSKTMKYESAFFAAAVMLGVTLLSVAIARCTHQPNNTGGFVVQKVATQNASQSCYEILEPGLLGSRREIIDSSGKFKVGDTLVLTIKCKKQ